MKCTIPGFNLKVFGRAIQSLSKLGDELYFEPMEDGLYLRTVNSCRSAYGFFQFSPSFFLHYIDGTASSSADEGDEALRCKIGMKSVMTVFKSLANIDKTVEKCRIALNMGEARLVFQMHCRHGIVKTHNLAFIECDSLQAVFSKDMCPNKITARPKLLCDAVLNFQTTQEEITLIVRPDFLALKNYTEDEPDKTKVIHTELTLDPDEFDQYQVGVDTEVTFCLKEMRAILAFVDITDLPLGLHFEAAGRPVTFTVNSDLSFEANFVLATLAEPQASQLPPPTPRQGQGSTAKRPRQNNRPDTNNTQHRNLNGHSNKTENKPQGDEEDMNDNDDAELSRMMDVTAPECSVNFADETIPQPRANALSRPTPSQPPHLSSKPNQTPSKPKKAPSKPKQTPSTNHVSSKTNSKPHSHLVKTAESDYADDDHNNAVDSMRGSEASLLRLESSRMSSGVDSLNRAPSSPCDSVSSLQTNPRPDSPLELLSPQVPMSRPVLTLRPEFGDSPDMSQVVPLMSDTFNSRINTEPDISQDEEDYEVPGTPPSKKFRALLFGTQSSQVTQPSQSQRKLEVLAPDSDDDS